MSTERLKIDLTIKYYKYQKKIFIFLFVHF